VCGKNTKKLRNERLNVNWEGRAGVVGRWVVEGKVGGGVVWTGSEWRAVMEGTILIEIMIK